jgi:hypothetical protein
LVESALIEEIVGEVLEVNVISLGVLEVLCVVLDVVQDSGEDDCGGDLADLLVVEIALGVGSVMKESVLNVSIHLLIILKLQVCVLSVEDSVLKVTNLVAAPNAKRLSKSDSSQSDEEERDNLKLHLPSKRVYLFYSL